MTEDIYRSLEGEICTFHLLGCEISDNAERFQGRPSTLESLIQTAKQPVPEVRMAAFATLHAIATHTWGQQIMANSGDFLGYLLDRTTEHSLPGQVRRFHFAVAENAIKGYGA